MTLTIFRGWRGALAAAALVTASVGGGLLATSGAAHATPGFPNLVCYQYAGNNEFRFLLMNSRMKDGLLEYFVVPQRWNPARGWYETFSIPTWTSRNLAAVRGMTDRQLCQEWTQMTFASRLG